MVTPDINDAGAIAGYYDEASGASHGFLATPAPVPASPLLHASGLAGLAAMRRSAKGRRCPAAMFLLLSHLPFELGH